MTSHQVLFGKTLDQDIRSSRSPCTTFYRPRISHSIYSRKLPIFCAKHHPIHTTMADTSIVLITGGKYKRHTLY